jgi:hypothetical protein
MGHSDGTTMRERRRGDWRIDLARRHPLETQVRHAIEEHPALTLLTSSTDSMDRLDFQVLGPGERLCEIELKAKHQTYRGWSAYRPDVAESDLFILDELALRKIVGAGRYGMLLVNDQPSGRWIVFTVMDLVLASKARVDRRLATGVDRIKAKVLLDLNDSDQHHASATAALSAVASYMKVIDRHWNAIEPWPSRHCNRLGAAS